MTYKKKDEKEFEFLKVESQRLGAEEVRIIPASEIVVEDDVIKNCKSGCPSYGKKLTCPPFVPTPDEFRKNLSEYRFALLVKFGPLSVGEQKSLKEVVKFQDECKEDKRDIMPVMLELEKVIFNAGYKRPLAFAGGSCKICERCNVRAGVCLHPEIARIPEHAVGINLRKTANNCGIAIKYPSVHHPEPIAVLLID